MKKDSDNILHLFKSGSEIAFSRIYDMYADRLLLFCYSYTKVRNDAMDIVQETFIRLWEMRGNIREDSDLKALLFTIARNRLVDTFRKRVNDINYEAFVKSYRHDTSYGVVDYDSYLQQAKQLLLRLPKAQRRVVYLSVFEGKKNEEIAEQLSIKEKTVRNLLSLGTQTYYRMIARTVGGIALFMSWFKIF